MKAFEAALHAYENVKDRTYPYPCISCFNSKVRFMSKKNNTRVQCQLCRAVFLNQTVHPIQILTRPLARDLVQELSQILNTRTNMEILDGIKKGANGKMLPMLNEYIPTVVTICSQVLPPFGFPATLDGLLGAFRSLESHVEESSTLASDVLELRKVFTPTGEWREADQMAIRTAGIKLEQKRLEEERILKAAADAGMRKRRSLFLELVRTRKEKKGLDPDQKYLPMIIKEPVSTVVYLYGTAYIEVAVSYGEKYQWYFNGYCMKNRLHIYSGVHTNVLQLLRVEACDLGTYTCTISNDDGKVVSAEAEVELAKIGLQEVGRELLNNIVYRIINVESSLLSFSSLQMMFLTEPGRETSTVTNIPISNVLSMAYCSYRIVLGFQKGHVHVYDARLHLDGKQLQLSPRMTNVIGNDDIRSVSFSHSGQKIVFPNKDHTTFYLLDTLSLILRRKLHFPYCIHSWTGHALSNTLAIAGSENGAGYAIWLQELEEKEERTRIARTLPVHRLAWNATGSRLMWAETGPVYSHIATMSLINPDNITRIAKAHVGLITGLQWCHQDRIIVSCGQDGFIKIFGIRPALLCMHSKMIHERGVLSMSINGNFVHVSTKDKALSTFRFRKLGELLHQTTWKEELTATRLQAIFRGKQSRDLYKKLLEEQKVHESIEVEKNKEVSEPEQIDGEENQDEVDLTEDKEKSTTEADVTEGEDSEAIGEVEEVNLTNADKAAVTDVEELGVNDVVHSKDTAEEEAEAEALLAGAEDVRREEAKD